MNKPIRIIPRLDIKGPNLEKGINLEGLRVLGNPIKFAEYYYQAGADEIFYMDVVASLYDRKFLKKVVNETSKKIFIPITVGGGLRTLKDIEEVLKIGADKVSLNTAALRNPNFIKKSINVFGSSTICISIEAVKHNDNKYYCYINNGRDSSGKELISWIKILENIGVGEIILTSVSHEGTQIGLDLNMIKKIPKKLSLPLIIHGGVGEPNHILKIKNNSNISGVAMSSVLHYKAINNISFKKNKKEGNVEYVTSRENFNISSGYEIKEIKKLLIKNNINCRI